MELLMLSRDKSVAKCAEPRASIYRGRNLSMKQVLLLKVGHTFEAIAARRGDYDAWFRSKLEPSGLAVEVVHVDRGADLPSGFDYAGVVVTGSFAMVTDREPWSQATASYLRTAVERGLPALGVCYGHQLLADAFGGRVDNNPRGRHAGTAHVRLTDEAKADRLFRGFPEALRVQVSHRQSVLELPKGAVLLGACDSDPHHAFRLGERAWGVQFHPEFDAEIARDYILARKEIFDAEGYASEALMAAVEDSVHGEELLQRFAEML